MATVKRVIMSALSLYALNSAAQQTCYLNPSVEGPSQAHVVPAPWTACYGSPDTQPGQWGITQAPSNGNSYVSFLHSGASANGYSEGMTQLLVPPMVTAQTYSFTVDLAHSNIYNTASPGTCYSSLAVWGGNAPCARTQLLWTSGSFMHTNWLTYTITFTPTANWTYLSFEPYYINTCSGYINCMLDNISCIQPSSVVTGTNSTCFNSCNGTATANPTSGTPPFTYLWTPGNFTTQTINGLCAGTYTCVVTDATAQTSSGSYTVTQPSQVVATAASTNILCNNVCSGTATATASGGTGTLTYLWSPGNQTTASVSGLCAGSYTVTVTDANGCSVTQTITITQPPALTAAATGNNVTCNNANNGSATVVATGGTGPYTYLWSPSGGNGPTASNLAPGNYVVTITDANNCITTANVTITQPTAITLNSAGFSETCAGLCNGQAVVIPSGGTSPFTYNWQPGNFNTASANNLCTGIYTIIVTDANGCTMTDTAIVQGPTAIALVTTSQPSNCGQGNGNASVTATGGSPGYTYLWAPTGGNAATATGLIGGVYTVTVTDNNGCSSTSTVTVIATPGVAASIPASTDALCFNACDGTANALPTGGTAPYTYLWSNAANTQNVTGLCSGTYTVTITDANGCTSSSTVTINQPAALSVTASSAVSICTGGNTNLTTLSNGGTLPYSFLWSNAATTPTTIVTPTATTTYIVTITDANGCTSSSSTIVTVNALPIVVFSAGPDSGCVPLCVTFTNTTPNAASCSWNFGNNSTSTNCNDQSCYNIAGQYSVSLTVTDNNGCIGTLNMPNLINAFAVPTAGFTVSTNSTSILDPYITVTNTCQGCDSSYYTISDGNNVTTTGNGSTFIHQFNDTGTYTITQMVITLQGCTAVYSTTIVIEPEFTLFVPNAFTPNGDGINEIFMPVGMYIDPNNYDLYIFDRWGNLIFHTATWGQGWDGKANGGKKIAQEDVYVWKIITKDFSGKKRQYVGHVSLIK